MHAVSGRSKMSVKLFNSEAIFNNVHVLTKGNLLLVVIYNFKLLAGDNF